jgi:hypothetical protein
LLVVLCEGIFRNLCERKREIQFSIYKAGAEFLQFLQHHLWSGEAIAGFTAGSRTTPEPRDARERAQMIVRATGSWSSFRRDLFCKQNTACPRWIGAWMGKSPGFTHWWDAIPQISRKNTYELPFGHDRRQADQTCTFIYFQNGTRRYDDCVLFAIRETNERFAEPIRNHGPTKAASWPFVQGDITPREPSYQLCLPAVGMASVGTALNVG